MLAGSLRSIQPSCARAHLDKQAALQPKTAHPPFSRRHQGLFLTGLLVAQPCLATEKQFLPINELKNVIRRSFIQDQYFTSGRLPKAVYADDAVLSDPTQTTKGIEQWSRVVPLLFDWKKSQVDLISIDVQDAHTIGIKFRLDAKFTPLFLSLKLKPFTASCTFRTNEQGLVVEQKEVWDLSAQEIALSGFLKDYGAPPAPPVQNPLKA